MSPDYLRIALEDAGAIELRHQSDEDWSCGLFDDLRALTKEVALRDSVGNLYTSLNSPRAGQVTNSMRSRSLRDRDVERIVRIPMDFDPVRPQGLPSTDAELRVALRTRDAVVSHLTELGWPAPALGLSGNGAHALYRTDLMAGPETADAMAQLYQGLAGLFGSEKITFDVTVRNPSRVWRLYGTWNRKGTPCADRLHRQSSIELPRTWEVVPSGLLLDTAAGMAPSASEPDLDEQDRHRPPLGAGDFRTLDSVAWFRSHNSYVRQIGKKKHAVLCPWSFEHSTPSLAGGSDTAIWTQEGGRWPSFHCLHSHCRGRSICDVMALWGDADEHCRAQWLERGRFA